MVLTVDDDLGRSGDGVGDLRIDDAESAIDDGRRAAASIDRYLRSTDDL